MIYSYRPKANTPSHWGVKARTALRFIKSDYRIFRWGILMIMFSGMITVVSSQKDASIGGSPRSEKVGQRTIVPIKKGLTPDGLRWEFCNLLQQKQYLQETSFAGVIRAEEPGQRCKLHLLRFSPRLEIVCQAL
jgi:hypothetical protein